MLKAIIKLETLACPSCLAKIEAAVKNVSGVDKDSVKVMFNASKVKVNFNDSTNIEVIEKAIQTMGYSVIKSSVRAA
ncbi:cation transporter [Aerococcaceae bacterium DSM 111022]|nr:cation transporter [Aerococcaceae bacterium DSM 111022]